MYKIGSENERDNLIMNIGSKDYLLSNQILRRKNGNLNRKQFYLWNEFHGSVAPTFKSPVALDIPGNRRNR